MHMFPAKRLFTKATIKSDLIALFRNKSECLLYCIYILFPFIIIIILLIDLTESLGAKLVWRQDSGLK